MRGLRRRRAGQRKPSWPRTCCGSSVSERSRNVVRIPSSCGPRSVTTTSPSGGRRIGWGSGGRGAPRRSMTTPRTPGATSPGRCGSMTRLVVTPAWREYTFSDEVVVVPIEPGGAFGLGDHPTTLLSLRAIRPLIEPSCTLLDVGCGTGVLAVTAAVLGATRVRAVDIASAAVEATRRQRPPQCGGSMYRGRHLPGVTAPGRVRRRRCEHSRTDAGRTRRRSPSPDGSGWAVGDQRHPR